MLGKIGHFRLHGLYVGAQCSPEDPVETLKLHVILTFPRTSLKQTNVVEPYILIHPGTAELLGGVNTVGTPDDDTLPLFNMRHPRYFKPTASRRGTL